MTRTKVYSSHQILQVENGFIVLQGGPYSEADLFNNWVFETFDAMVKWLRLQTEAVQIEREMTAGDKS